MSLLHSFPVDEIRARGSIRDGDVALLEQAWRQSGEIVVADVETLLRLNQSCPIKDRAWSDLLVEIVTECVVRQMEPAGYVTLAKMRWLIGRIASGDAVIGRTELELLLNIIDKARWAPASLAAFAVTQVERAVRTGEGPLRAGVRLVPGRIMEAEIDFVRRILFAFGHGKALPVTSAEASALLDISAALDPHSLPAEWIDLFVKATANAVLAAGGFAAPTREEALRISASVSALGRRTGAEIIRDAFASVAGADAGPSAETLPAVWGTYRRLSVEEQALARLERQRIEIITDEALPAADTAWLKVRLGGRDRLNAGETALVQSLRRDCPSVDAALGDLIERMEAAA